MPRAKGTTKKAFYEMLLGDLEKRNIRGFVLVKDAEGNIGLMTEGQIKLQKKYKEGKSDGAKFREKSENVRIKDIKKIKSTYTQPITDEELDCIE